LQDGIAKYNELFDRIEMDWQTAPKRKLERANLDSQRATGGIRKQA